MEGSIHLWLRMRSPGKLFKNMDSLTNWDKVCSSVPALVGSGPSGEFSCATLAGNSWVYEVTPTVSVLKLSPSEGSQGFVSSYIDLSS